MRNLVKDGDAERCFKAVERYLSQRGYEIRERRVSDDVDFVAIDGGASVLVLTCVSEDGFVEPFLERSDIEKEMVQLALNGSLETDASIRVDTVSMHVLGEDSALLRHHINCEIS